MIKHASELLERFINEEKKKLAEFEMPHMPTLGGAYEEVTKQGIDQQYVIPKFLNLHTVSGFIMVGGKMLPQQIDCMLVEGDGKRYGLTNQFVYDIEKVLCIFEVKKTLTKADYLDAFDHLGAIRKAFAQHFEEKLRSGKFEPKIDHARKTFAQITGKIAPVRYLDIHELTKEDAMIFYTLVQEQNAPASIVHGYGGYKTEEGIRRSFMDIIEERATMNCSGLGVPSLPSLVTSNEYSVVKGNGNPYISIRDDNAWVVLFSMRHNPIKTILEVVWTKISNHLNVKMPYGNDMEMENIAPLLIAEPVRVGSEVGWVYKSIEYVERNLQRGENSLWSPAKIGKAEMSVVDIMAMRGGYLELDKELDKYLIKNYQCSLTLVTENLIKTRMFALEDGYLRPLAKVTFALSDNDEGGFIALDRNRFDSWCCIHNKDPYYLTLVFLDEL